MILTLCKSVDGERTYQKTDFSAFPLPYLNDIINVEIKDLEELHSFYLKIAENQNLTQVIGRCVEKQRTNTDRKKYNFVEAPVDYLILDLDKYEPDNSFIRRGVESEHLLTDQMVEHDVEQFIVEHLPPEFQRVSYIYRLSSSFFKEGDTRLRMHLIFCLEEEVYPMDLGLWMKTNELPVDSSVYFNWSRPIFSAYPAFVRLVDPLKHIPLQRIRLIKKELELVPGWKPLALDTQQARERRQAGIKEIIPSKDLPGEMGAFNRSEAIETILNEMGYVDMGSGRWIAPGSETGAPGVVVFDNGYCFSHHEADIIDQINHEIYGGRKTAFHAYSLAFGLAKLQGNDALSKFKARVLNACSNDAVYNDEEKKLLYSGLEFLDPAVGFEGINRRIIDNLMISLANSFINPLLIQDIFKKIKTQTGNRIGVQVLNDQYTHMLRKLGNLIGDVNIKAEPFHNAEMMCDRKEIIAEGSNPKGGFYIYQEGRTLWSYCDRDLAKAYLERMFTNCLPDKNYFKPAQLEQQVKYTLNMVASNGNGFVPGEIWAFSEGQAGISLESWDNEYIDWHPDKVVRTLNKNNHVVKTLPITYDQWNLTSKQKPERFLNFMRTTFEDDWERINIMQEWFGYLFDFTYPHQKFMYMEGLPGSGKSVISKIMESVVSSQYTLYSSLNRIATEFGLEGLPNKHLLILSEARFAEYAEKAAYNEILLRITGTDKFDINRKHMKAIQTQSPAKVIIMSNQTPILADETGALLQRLILMKFNKTFRNTDQEVFNIEREIIEQELPSIIRWSLEGLLRLKEQGRFSESKVNQEHRLQIDEAVSPLKVFMERYFVYDKEADKDFWVTVSKFRLLFRAFYSRVRNQKLNDGEAQKKTTINQMRSIFPYVQKTHLRYGHDRERVYKNLIFKYDPEEINSEFMLDIRDLDDTE